jgi:hypothetical protein
MSDCDAGRVRATRRAATRKGAVRLALPLLLAAAPAAAQAPLDAPAPATFRSLGQPPRFKPYVAGSLTWNREDAERLGGVGVVGVYKDLVLPISGAFGLSAEGYAGGIGSAPGASGGWDGGARLFATSRLLFLNAGVDWNARTEKADFILAFTPYFRRGGLFGSGGNFRIEWIPGRNHSFNFGFQVPLEKHMGKTRPRERDARLPKASRPAAPTALDAGTRAQLATVRDAGRWLILHANFFNDDDDSSFLKAMDRFRADIQQARALFQQKDADHPEGRSYALESRHYHDAFDAAFASAVGPREGAEVSTRARESLLDEVLLPYDRLVGRFKKHDTLAGLVARGRASFARSLEASAGLDAARRAAALAVYDEIAAILERSREVLKKHQDGDERKVWMSLDLALRPEQHDSQEEIDAVVARALARPFTRGNAIFPTNGSRFQLELIRSLHAARDYHVLWIHDYAGRVGGKPDPVAHAVTLKGYLAALASRVAEYDETGRLPAFFLFQTQFFYEGSQSRLYLDLLEDPLGRELKLGDGQQALEAEVREAQAALRRAVAGSKRLQAQARERGGDAWLRRVIRVHVSVTFPADLSFRSSRVVGFLPFAPDSITLDHRKLFFYDVTEDDPGSGQALFSGTGVGSEYGGPTWDDRGLLASGPALLQLKREACRLLRSQGYAEGDVPLPLRERPLAAGYASLVDARETAGSGARALNVHNEVGFGRKEATLAQAILYTLAPADTVIVAPDSLWASPFWAGQLAGAALRGCHVYVVAPSLDNAPAAGAPILARTREIFARLLEVRRIMAAEIAASGGHLRVGLYTRAAASGDTLGKIREAAAGLRRHAFLAHEFPMPADTPRLFDEVAGELETSGYKPQFIASGTREGRPKMHRKTQLLVTRRALRAYADLPETRQSLRLQLGARAKATADPGSVFAGEDPLETERPILERMRHEPLPGTDGSVYYLTVGSKNQDPRGAFLDGETSFVVAGPWSLVGYSDFLLLMAATTWVEDEAELTKLIPVEEEKARKLGRLISKVL